MANQDIKTFKKGESVSVSPFFTKNLYVGLFEELIDDKYCLVKAFPNKWKPHYSIINKEQNLHVWRIK